MTPPAPDSLAPAAHSPHNPAVPTVCLLSNLPVLVLSLAPSGSPYPTMAMSMSSLLPSLSVLDSSRSLWLISLSLPSLSSTIKTFPSAIPRGGHAVMSFIQIQEDRLYGAVNKDVCGTNQKTPEFSAQCHSGKRKPTPRSYPLTSPCAHMTNNSRRLIPQDCGMVQDSNGLAEEAQGVISKA